MKTAIPFVLRDYQKESIQKTRAARKKGKSKAYINLATGCHRKGQKVIMYDGTVKCVEDVVVGDKLMGPDSTPRIVLELHRGIDDMVEIKPVKGETWVVNKGHILSLVHINERSKEGTIFPCTRGGNIVDVSVLEWQENWSKKQKHVHKLFRVPINFQSQKEKLPLHPYLLGILLGDGGLSIEGRVHFTNIDECVLQEMRRLLEETGETLQKASSENRTQTYRISARTGKGRPPAAQITTKRILDTLGLLPIRCEKRFIPQIYKTASKEERLQLLAGLLDTDGSLTSNTFDIVSKSSQLIDDILFVARSVGLAGQKTEKIINGIIYYRTCISGDCSIIPTRIQRKQAQKRQQKKNVLHTGFSCTPTNTREEYYGFVLDGDHRYLLDDFTVTHNTGKTIIFLFLCLEEIRKGGKVLIIAHREKLLQQPGEKLALLDPTADIGIIGFGREEWGHTVTIGGIQTLSCSEVRLDRLEQEGFTLVIWDEVHHVLSQSYQNVMARLKSAFHFGVTATPDRGDGRRVESIFGPALVERSIRRMVDEGHLCDLFPYMITTTTTLDSVQTSKKKHDYIQSELEHVVNCIDRNRLIVETCQKPEYGGPDLSTVCFCAGRAHAQELAEAFCQAGIPAAALLDDTKDHLRDQIYTDFATGKLKIITNVDVCGEGWDADVRRVCLCRPTQSRAKYTQQIGRGTRPAPGKQGCYILDFTDNCTRHALEPVSYEDILEVEIAPGETLKEASAKAQSENVREEREDKKENTAKGGEVVGQKVEVLGKFDWQKSKKGAYQVNIGRSRLALIPSEQQPGYYHVGLRFQPNVLAEPRIHKVAENLPLTWAQALAEQKARQLQAGKAGFVDPDAPWRTQPMTKDQAKRLHLLGIHKKMNRGQASDMLGKVYSKK